VGAYFVEHHLPDCSIAAFQRALAINPHDGKARFNLGLVYISQNLNTLAVEQLRKALAEDNKNPEIHSALGTALAAEGKFTEAQAEFEAVLAILPGSADALFNRGQSLVGQKRYGAAIASFQQALEVRPGNADYAFALSDALVKSGNIDKAVAVLKTFTKEHPESALGWFNLGVVEARIPSLESAIDSFQESLRLAPQNDQARELLAHNLIDASRYPEALPLVNNLLQQSPENAEYLSLRGSVWRGEGQFDAAISDFQKAAAIQPRNFDIQYGLGFCLAKANRLAEAETHLEKALDLRPDSDAAKFQLMSVLRSRGETEKAQKLANELQTAKQATLRHDLANAAGAKGNEDVLAGKYREAIAQYQSALALEPNNAETLFNLSVAQKSVGDLQGEKASLLRAARLDSDLGKVQDALGLVYERERQGAEAERAFDLAVKFDPQCALCKVHLGEFMIKAGEPKPALRLLRQAVDDDSNSEEAQHALGMALAAMGAFEEARYHLRAAATIGPDNPETLSELGKVEGKLADPDTVVTLEKVVKLRPESAESHLDYGMALADRNRPSDALAQFNAALEIAPHNAMALYNKGRVLTDLKNFQDAMPVLEEALRLQPSQTDAYYFLALAQLNCGDPSAALASLKPIAASHSMDAPAYLLQGSADENLGKMPEAIEAWKSALRLQPNSREALYKLSRAYKHSNPEISANYLARFQSASGADERRKQADALGSIGSKFARSGDWKTAVDNFDEALEVCGDCDLAWQLRKDLGLSLCNEGDLVRGEKELRTVNAQKPDDPEITYALRLIERSRAK
jgi:tetratricopeptide (TPR) repeat protein